MNTRNHSIFCAVALSALSFFTITHQARADLLIDVDPDPINAPVIERYSNTGVDLGLFANTSNQAQRLYYSSGSVYTLGSATSTLSLNRYDATTHALLATNPATNPSLGNLPVITTAWNGNLLVGTGGASGNSPSLLQLNPSTLQYTNTALTVPVPSSGYPFTDIAFGPDNKLYVAQLHSVKSYTQSSGGVITADTSFNVSPSSFYENIAFSPIDPNNAYLVVADLNGSSLIYHVDRYSIATGQYVNTFVTPATFSSIGSGYFTIGDDGTFYFINGTGKLSIVSPATGLVTRQSTISTISSQGITFVPSITPEPATLLTLAFTAYPLLLRRKNRQ